MLLSINWDTEKSDDNNTITVVKLFFIAIVIITDRLDVIEEPFRQDCRVQRHSARRHLGLEPLIWRTVFPANFHHWNTFLNHDVTAVRVEDFR